MLIIKLATSGVIGGIPRNLYPIEYKMLQCKLLTS